MEGFICVTGHICLRRPVIFRLFVAGSQDANLLTRWELKRRVTLLIALHCNSTLIERHLDWPALGAAPCLSYVISAVGCMVCRISVERCWDALIQMMIAAATFRISSMPVLIAQDMYMLKSYSSIFPSLTLPLSSSLSAIGLPNFLLGS